MLFGGFFHWGLAGALLGAALLAIAVGPRQAHAAGCAFGGAGWGTKKPVLAKQVVKQVNDYRRRKGLAQLATHPTLSKAAMWKAGHMAKFDYFGHHDEGNANRSPGARLLACGYRGNTWGENIAYGYTSAGQVTRGWINSPGHRANLENPTYRAIGVGAVAARGRGTIYWAQAFGVGSGPTRKAAPKPRGAVKVSRTSRLGKYQQQAVKFDMPSARRGRLAVRPLNAKGARPVSVRLHCDGSRIASATGRRRAPAKIARRIPAGRCAAMVLSGRQPVSYKITLTLY